MSAGSQYHETLLEKKREVTDQLLTVESRLSAGAGWRGDRQALIQKKTQLLLLLRDIKAKLSKIARAEAAELQGEDYDPEDPMSLIAALRDEIIENARETRTPLPRETQALLDDAQAYVRHEIARRAKVEAIKQRIK